jgi:putative membrane protein
MVVGVAGLISGTTSAVLGHPVGTLLASGPPRVLAHGGDESSGGVFSGPPAPTVVRMLRDWSFDWVPVLMVSVLAMLYLWGVWRLYRRGDHWGVGRTIAWLGGCFVVAYSLFGGVAQYDDTLFSAHAVQHMMLSFLAPIPLALGAPVTLALRALPVGPRRGLLWLLHTRVAKVLCFPLTGFLLLTVSLYGLYFSGLYNSSLHNDLLHESLHLHFLMAGCLFYWPIIGVDPLPGRLPYWGRLMILFMSFPIHALLGLTIMSTTQVFAGDYYEELHRPYALNLLSDQHTGGALMWGFGELIGALVFVALFIQWSRADAREAVRTDRRLDRQEAALARAEARGEKPTAAQREASEWAAYNDKLAALAAADARRAAGSGR